MEDIPHVFRQAFGSLIKQMKAGEEGEAMQLDDDNEATVTMSLAFRGKTSQAGEVN